MEPDIQQSQNLTVIIPAYNEAASISDTILSLQNQTIPPKEIIVVDDFSDDSTSDIAKKSGVTVLRPPANTGSKAGAQNFALHNIDTEYTMAIDADTTLAVDAIEILMKAFSNPKVAAACGFLIPRHINTVWERGRFIEYLITFTFYKPIQDYFGRPLISSGCFSIYNTQILKKMNGWPTRTMAEDMDLTWSLYETGYRVRFFPEATCYPIEPYNFTFMKKQLRRWSHGFIQNIMLHWRSILHISYLNSIIGVAAWDAVVASFVYVLIFPFLALITLNPLILLGFIIDAPIELVPVIYMGITTKKLIPALISFPSFFFLRTVNAVFMLEAVWNEVILKKRLTQYEKGH